MSGIFRINEKDIPWAEFKEVGNDQGHTAIRYKALTYKAAGPVPPVQYVEYAPGHADPTHSHPAGEVLIVTDGELWLEGVGSGSGSIVFIPGDTEYSVRGGDEGVRFFRVVVP